MDWTKQSEEMFATWMQTQQKMWETFSESMSGFGKSPSEKLWQQTIKAGEELVKNTLASQAEWAKTWAESFKSMEGLPEQAHQAVGQFQEMAQRGSETQERLWAAWFGMLKKMDPSQFTGSWGEMPKNPFQVWQDSTKMIMDTQMEWMQAWMNQFTPKEEE